MGQFIKVLPLYSAMHHIARLWYEVIYVTSECDEKILLYYQAQLCTVGFIDMSNWKEN